MSSSKSRQQSSESITDSRIAASDNAQAINSGGGAVSIVDIPDEAFEVAEFALDAVSGVASDGFALARANARDAMETVQRGAEISMMYGRTESTQIAETVVKVAIPAALLALVISKGKLFK